MVTKTFSFEFTSPVSAARMFNASFLDRTNLATMVMHGDVASAAIVQLGGGLAGLFEASVLKITNLAPKIMEDAASAAILQGDGGVGSSKLLNKPTDALTCSHGNERVDLLDKEKFECKYRVSYGADAGTNLASVAYHVKFVPTSNGGCVCKLNVEERRS